MRDHAPASRRAGEEPLVMISNDKAADLLLELGNPGARRTRAAQLDLALRTALALTEADAAVVVTSTSRRAERLVLHAGSTGTAVLPSAPQVSEIVRTLTTNSQPLMFADLSEETRIAASDGCPGVEAGPAIFTALRQRDPAPGYMAIYRRRGRQRFTVSDRRAMLLLASWLSTALECLRLSSGIEKLSLTDDLTEVYNARFLKTALRRELRRAGRFGQVLSIVLVEVDNLETFHDEHGELRGSLLLREVASLLAHHLRSFDLMARYRNDRFMLVLPQTGPSGAVEVAERMRTVVERHAFSFTPPGTVTVSIGVASFPQEGTDMSGLLGTVERALAQARQRGMNCVESIAGHAA